VKYFRSFIVVLLTVLLPIRGAVAAAMLCPGEVSMIGAAATVGHGGHDMHADHDMEVHHAAPPDHSHGPASAESPAGGHATACQFCAGGCCVTPLAFAPPSVESPCVAASAVFPTLTARVTAFYPDGQDRPPRTI
jgi:hypothetical protein